MAPTTRRSGQTGVTLMFHVEQNSINENWWHVTMDGKARTVIIYCSNTNSSGWWVGFEDGDFDDDQRVGGFLSAQVVALELLNSLAG